MTPIIQKCVDELNKESPRLDYLRGMLESLLVMNPTPVAYPTPNNTPAGLVPAKTVVEEIPSDEQSAIDAYEKGTIGKIS